MMIRKHKKSDFKVNQKGYVWMFLVTALVLIGVFFIFPLKYSELPEEKNPDDCYFATPRVDHSFQDEGETFELIKAKAPIITVQRKVHLETGKHIIVEGKERNVTKAYPSEKNDNISNWYVDGMDASWQNIRFADVSDSVADKAPGTSYYDIYVKKGAAIPKQIIQFCQENPSETRGVFSDNRNKSFPPLAIDGESIQGWHCDVSPVSPAEYERCMSYFGPILPAKGKYYLYAYDTDTSEVVKLVKRNEMGPKAKISLEYNGKQQEFDIVYYNWESRHLRLEFTDPKTGMGMGFRYANPERLAIPEDPYKFLNEKDTVPPQDSLQLQALSPLKVPAAGWWTPECKPAIYLYPNSATAINVKVRPAGFLTYTSPVYDDSKGWNVKAYPGGNLEWLDSSVGINSKGEINSTNHYPYLYYESKIHDSMIEKPTEGFIVKYQNLEQFYKQNLPLYGLNEKETNDYIEYWKNVLPESPYYQIGLMNPANIEAIEPLAITPAPDSLLRLRLYYEPISEKDALEKMKTIIAPEVDKTFSRSGFSVIEWGGMVKQDMNHPFTCSI